MIMYSYQDVIDIIQEFMAKHFGFEYVTLNTGSIIELKTICENYGIEVDNIIDQSGV